MKINELHYNFTKILRGVRKQNSSVESKKNLGGGRFGGRGIARDVRSEERRVGKEC